MSGASRLRVAILSDTHGHLDVRVERAAASCDLVVHAGDIGTNAVLRSLGSAVRAVRGNNDDESKWPAEELGILETIPWEQVIDLPGGRLAVTHGHQRADVASRHRWLRKRFPDARAIVYGHTHRAGIDRSAAPWIVNPGAAGRSRTFGGPSMVVLDVDGGRWRLRTRRYPPQVKKPR